jgi:hypothetical protein
MKRIFFNLTIMFSMLTQSVYSQEILKSGYFVATGDDKVFIIDPSKSNENHAEVVWQWNATEAIDIPAGYKNYLKSLDECKPVLNNTKILVCSSSGATLLIDIATKKVDFYARTPMAHSADLLPGNRIAVANSTHKDGNNLELYEIGQSEHRLFSDTLYSGHGVVWDWQRERLFVLGYQLLKSYSLENWNSNSPSLKLEKSWIIPDESGHDLSMVDGNHLLISTHHSIFSFDIEEEQFTEFVPLKGRENLKSVNYNPETENIVYTIAEESWWTENIYQTNPKKTISLPGVHLYKVRVAK